MKAMNSVTHSWTHSFASLAIFALSGRDVFIIRDILAIGRSAILSPLSPPCDSNVKLVSIKGGAWRRDGRVECSGVVGVYGFGRIIGCGWLVGRTH
jgi:hypothetical protein